MASIDGVVVILGTGGTIAGTADRATDSVGYRAARLAVEALVAAVPALGGLPIECQQVAQLDSKDMGPEIWLALAQALSQQLSRPEVCGVVVTHGTDTLEETAYFLHRVLPQSSKPVVLTAAMRPATALLADGPQNLLDAVTLARVGAWQGVHAVLGARVYAAVDLRKLHGWRIDAFEAGDAGELGLVQDGMVRRFRESPARAPHAAATQLPPRAQDWPVVDIVPSHAGARGAVVDALCRAGAAGLVIAGTGNGSVHRDLLQATRRAAEAGVSVVRATRCLRGGVFGHAQDALPSYGELTPWQARIELMLDLLLRRAP
jgi:L-asparaginase